MEYCVGCKSTQLMSEQLQALLEALKTDAGLQEKLKGSADLDAAVAIANEAGFVISADELQRAEKAEISDKDLQAVAGGGGGLGYTNSTCLFDCWTESKTLFC